MSETVRADIDWAFSQDGVVRVLENAGMTREGTLHRWRISPNLSHTPTDVHVYAIWR